ncbi:MAG: type II CRISPR RNA-guided endonuclease Cas9 [Gammaproteobacteria bacterium]|nr:type II CRISPR RNA-guided endonuclease Cas9 [Gammaproteobacteria bacterium]
MKWRLGIDLGTNSLGWWAFKVGSIDGHWQPRASLGGGVYIFPSGREPASRGRVGDSYAVKRRLARRARRNRVRRKARLRAYMRELVHLGLMSESIEQRRNLFQTLPGSADPHRFNPYFLRAQAVERTLEPHELGRALFHLGLRRGYKTNRIGQQEDNNDGDFKEQITHLKTELDGQTLGQFQWAQIKNDLQRQHSGEPPEGIRFRGRDTFFPERSMYEAEFEAIRQRQAPDHDLTQEDWTRLKERYVLFQWPLKPVSRGPCEFFPDEMRHWNDTPIGHDFRIYQELNSLRWYDGDYQEHALDPEQYTAVRDLLLSRKSEVKFNSLRRLKKADKSLLFPDCAHFNLETEGLTRTGIKPHGMVRILDTHPELAPLWAMRCTDEGDSGLLDDIFSVLLEEADQEALKTRLSEDFSLEEGVIGAFGSLELSRATAGVSRKFMEAIVPILRDQHLLFQEAVREIEDDEGNPLHHRQGPVSNEYEELPYYGEILHGSMAGMDAQADPATQPEQHFGKIGNPTVHIALNSLRRVVNALISRFGAPPVEIHVELSRDLKNRRRKREIASAIQARNQKDNDRIYKELKALGIHTPSRRDIRKYKLWEELGEDSADRCCPFTGKPISCAQLFNGKAEIEHILPFKRTLDDSMVNLTIALRWANRLKGNQTPYEAFGEGAHSKDGIHWETVTRHAARLPSNKKWRFAKNAMHRFEREHDFITRQLTDNTYFARSTAQYLSCLKGVEEVVPNRGHLTALVRGKWGLNRVLSDSIRKERGDHRHHAIDAAVIALVDRSVLKRVSDYSGRGGDDRVHIVVPELDERINASMHRQVHEMVVAFKPDHGLQGQMFNETAYGFIQPGRRDPDFPEYTLVTRKPITDLTLKECDRIRDLKIRKDVASYLNDARKENETHKKALVRFSQEQGIRSVRILIKDQAARQIESAPYKRYATSAYACCDIWRLPKGKAGKYVPGEFTWRGVFWSYADVSRGSSKPEERKPHPAARFICRLYKNDMIVCREDMAVHIMRVAGFSTTNNKLDVVPHWAADPGQRYVSINQLGINELQKLHVTPDGVVKGLKNDRRTR